MQLAYLACPYSHHNPKVQEERFHHANVASGVIMSAGFGVFSPISMSHPIAVAGEIPGTWEHWKEFDMRMVEIADLMFVLRLSGWKESVGVREEMLYAASLYKPIGLLPLYFSHDPEWSKELFPFGVTHLTTIDDVKQLYGLGAVGAAAAL